MNYFSVFYMMPVDELDKWMQTPAEEREASEAQFKQDWDAWIEAHKDMVLNTIAMGKTKLVNGNGVQDTRNTMMLSSYAQGESLEAVAEAFKDHPHLKLPGATIEVVQTRPM